MVTVNNKVVATGWKPDFTKSDPWRGMPQGYVEAEAAAYKPTEDEPLPPSERTPEGMAARDKAPRVSRDIASIRDISEPEDYSKFRKLQDEQKFKKAVELGLIPEGSEFAPGLKITYAPGVPKEERVLKAERWGYYTPEQVAGIKAAEAKAEKVAKAREVGIERAREIVTARQARELTKFKRAHTELPDGKWIDDAQLTEIKMSSPEIYTALMTKGLATADKAIAEQQKVFEATNIKLPDGQWINKEELAKIKLTAPLVYKELKEKGFVAADKAIAEQQKVIEVRKPSETFKEQHIRLTGKPPPTIGAFEEQEVSLIDKFVSFFTGKGTGRLAPGTEFLQLSIPGFMAGMSGAQAQTQAETESLYRYLFKEQTGRFPTLGEMPDIKAGLPRDIQVASVVPGVVTAYRWDTMSDDQKWQAIGSDIATAALYGMMAVGLVTKPAKVPVVKYKLVNEFGVPTGKTIKVPVYAPDVLGTKFAVRNPALWQRGATPLKIYGETGIKPITPLLGVRELVLRKPQVPTLPLTFKGGVRTPAGLIPPTHIPATTYYPGASYTTARGVKINIPAGTVTSKGLIPSGMEIWSRKGLEQPWSPFSHTGARVLISPTTGTLTIVDVATGKIKEVGLPATGAEVAIGVAPREPSTLTMTPEQAAKLKPVIAPAPYIEYEVTPGGLVAPRIIPYPKPRQVVYPDISPVIRPSGKPSPAVAPSPALVPTPRVTPTPAPTIAIKPAVAIEPAVAPKPAVEAKPAVVPARVPAVVPRVVPKVVPVAVPIPVPAIPVLLSGKQMKGKPLTKKELKTAVAWPQGFGWWVVFMRGGKRYRYFHHGQEPPRGIKQVKQGIGEAARGIQRHKGVAPVSFKLPLGAVDVSVESPSRDPGKTGAIDFTPTRVSTGKPRLTPPRPAITSKRPRIR